MPPGIFGGFSMRGHFRWLPPLALLLSACGSAQGTAALPGDSGPSTVLGSAFTTESVSPAISESTAVDSTPPSSAEAPPTERSMTTEIGTVSYSLPETASPDPIRPPPVPDFGLGSEQWIIPDCCRLIVALQKVEPLMPETQMISQQEVNGIIWKTYDTGPEDGSQITAVGINGPLSVLVSTQTAFGDQAGAAASLAVVADLVQTITFTKL